ncbi:intraflagellar transport protein 25 homolog isoform X2 [Takifugu rubripes]|uniref:intraflagellar transport protein 25 homolog isoform X2 n=1 Tax=Takifugu rubripes TaxID=31033 RepID=UPI001145FA29|nr:intraflagellar transport protein 25 homolog isoform X2 [Takifugu rubripes]
MENSSLRSLGAKVVVVSSSDEKHPPENIIDGNTESFWMSTGLFPQEFIIGFTHSTNISAVTMDSYNEFDHVTGCLQSNTLPVNGIVATHLRFIITSGHDHFVSVHRVSVQL